MTKEREFLIDRYFQNNSVGCEIGVYRGTFSKMLIHRRRMKTLYLIDPWQAQRQYVGRWYSSDKTSQIKMNKMYGDVKSYFNRYPEVKILRGYSQLVFKKISNNELDWVYIDGDHSEIRVYHDLWNSFRKVKNGGYIIGDDYNWRDGSHGNSTSIKNAVTKFLEHYKGRVKLIEIQNKQYVIQKINDIKPRSRINVGETHEKTNKNTVKNISTQTESP